MVARRIVAGPHVRNAAARHLRDLKDGPKRGLVWDLASALRAINFFRDVLRLNGGQFEGIPFALHPSQAFRVGSLFGWKRADGTRRFRRFYDEEGKGNGKSPMLAGIGLYAMLADGEARSEVYAAASKKDQAMVLFRDAVAMVDQSPALSSRLTKSGGNPVWNLAHLPSGSFFRPISSDDGQSGPRPHFALCDEVHEHRDRNTIDMLERGFKFRRQPLLCMATNAGHDRNSICWEEREHAVKVAAGEVEHDETFSFVCSLDDGDDPLEDPSCWVKANPLLGTTITEKYLADVVAQAKAIPGKRNGILRLHFCVWTDAVTSWIARPAWEACERRITLDDYEGEQVWLGLDMSFTRDLTALALVFKRDAELHAFVDFWTPGDTLSEREIRDRAPYRAWVEQGLLEALPGKVIPLGAVAGRLAELMERFEVMALAYDRYRHKELDVQLQDLGVDIPMIEHPQGFRRAGDTPLWMPNSVRALEDAVIERRLVVPPHPVLRSNVACSTPRDDPAGTGNRILNKAKSTGRIDGAVALAMAIGAATASVEVSVPLAPWEDPEFRLTR